MSHLLTTLQVEVSLEGKKLLSQQLIDEEILLTSCMWTTTLYFHFYFIRLCRLKLSVLTKGYSCNIHNVESNKLGSLEVQHFSFLSILETVFLEIARQGNIRGLIRDTCKIVPWIAISLMELAFRKLITTFNHESGYLPPRAEWRAEYWQHLHAGDSQIFAGFPNEFFWELLARSNEHLHTGVVYLPEQKCKRE